MYNFFTDTTYEFLTQFHIIFLHEKKKSEIFFTRTYLVSHTHSNLEGCCFLNTYTWLLDILSWAIITYGEKKEKEKK